MSRKVVAKRRGVTLILAVMIMSAVVAIGITLSTVLVFQVRINSVVKEGHQGYYAAESGIELGLNKINELKSLTLANALAALQTAELPDGADSAYNAFFYPSTKLLSTSVAAPSSAAIPTTVKENQGVFIELYNVDDSLNATSGTNFSAPLLCVYAESADGGNDEILEVSWVGWGTGLNVSTPQKVLASYSAFHTGTCSTPKGSGLAVPLTQFYPAFSPTAFAGFRIRITPLNLAGSANGDVVNMAVDTNPAVTSQIQLKSVSSGAGQKQALVALFPWSLPLSSLFDFVIFSEQTLTKDKPISIVQDLKRYGPFAAVAGGPTDIPTTPTNAFSSCSSSVPCTYFVRLISDSTANNGWEETSLQVNAGDGSQQNIGALNAKSCIIINPFTFTTTYKITFTNIPTTPRFLQTYELMTRPAFSTPEENYCP